MDDNVSLVPEPAAGADAAAAAPGASAAGDPAAAQAAEAAAAAAAAAAAKPTEAKAGDTPKAEEKPAEKPAEAKGAPDAYEAFKVPDGFEMDEAMLGEFTPVLKGAGLSQENAQKVMDFAPKFATAVAERTTAAVLEASGLGGRENWATQVKTDKELGGEKLGENLAVARKALDAYGTPELKAFFAKTKLGDHPEVVRVFARMGREIKPDGFVPGGATRTPSKFFDKSNMNP